MTNFDFLKKDEKFSSFADIAITAEKLYGIDTASCVFNWVGDLFLLFFF